MTKNYTSLEKQIEKKYAARDKKKKPKMPVSGKSVFDLQRIMTKQKNRKGNS